MPSIRLRGTYSSLRDSPSTSTTPRVEPLTTLFIANAETTDPNPSPHPRIHRSMPTLRLEVPQSDSAPAAPEVPPRHGMRPRSGTTNSRISSYIMGNSRHYARSTTSDSGSEIGFQSPLLSPRDALVTHEGPQAEVTLHTNEKPGVIESTLNLLDSESSSSLDVHHDDIVDHLDVIDPQIGTVSKLTNAANALLIPPNMWYSRKPVVQLSRPPSRISELGGQSLKPLEDTLDRHVDDVLQRPSKLRRTMMAMGVIVAIYGFCVVFWGAAIVFFLAKIINFHNANTQGFWVEVSSQVVNVSLGLD
ncbi:hypothetical protein H0H92_012553 [Tricholoma furcatifolium]|nr:hypothetical protein H0H92_012553 [Tricholoma furcatifolium]